MIDKQPKDYFEVLLEEGYANLSWREKVLYHIEKHAIWAASVALIIGFLIGLTL